VQGRGEQVGHAGNLPSRSSIHASLGSALCLLFPCRRRIARFLKVDPCGASKRDAALISPGAVPSNGVWRDDSFVDLRGKLLLAQGPCSGAVDYAIRVARTIKISRLKIGKAKAELPK